LIFNNLQSNQITGSPPLGLTLPPSASKLSGQREAISSLFKLNLNPRSFIMAEGYCVKCKAKKEIANGVEETMKNGRKAIKGKCPTCGTVMFKILGGKATPPASTPPPAAA
jgi:hypothetical protein